MSQEYKFIAKTFRGLEEVLTKELLNIGANNVKTERRAVSFTGNLKLLYKANLYLRTASRVLLPIAEFNAKDVDEVYESVKKIKWDQYLTVNNSFAIDSTVYSDIFRHSRYVTYRVKDAIVDFFRERVGNRPSVKIEGADLYINVHIAQKKVTISLDSSGESLHKRGWRVGQTTASINEALAAGMILLTGWHGESDFIDPMCGSGTLLIEAALIAKNIAPGIYRKEFAFEKWKNFDRSLFEELYNDDSEEKEFLHHIYGSDSSFYAIQQADRNIKNAGLQKCISLRQCPIQSLKEGSKPCIIVTNPPYGERLKEKEIMKLYDEMGSVFKHKFSGNTAWVISSNENAMKNIGLRPTQKFKLLNGELECTFNRYELFEGKVEEWKKSKHDDLKKKSRK